MAQDIVIQTLQALADVLREHGAPVHPLHIAEAERIVKLDWGGDRAYIPRSGENYQREMNARDRAICRDHRRGDHPPVLARRYSLSVRRIRQILQFDLPDTETPCLTGFPTAAQHADHDADRADQRARRADGRRHRQVAKDTV